MLIETGQAINAYVRELFATGHKSGNKFYSMGARIVSPDSYLGRQRYEQYKQKAEYREEHVWLVNKIIANRPESMLDIAKAVKKCH